MINTFTSNTSRINLSSDETLATSLGKISKFLNDLTDIAFSNDYNDLDNLPTKIATASKLAARRSLNVNLSTGIGTSFDGSSDSYVGYTGILPITVGGTGNTTGSSTSAKKLSTEREITVNLSTDVSEGFDGSDDVTIGATGVLPISHGGTGNSSGLAANATKLATARTINGVLFDGTSNISIETGVIEWL